MIIGPVFLSVLLAAGLILIVTAYRRNRYYCCGKCGYQLTGLPNAEHCPECGTVLDGNNIRNPGEIMFSSFRLSLGMCMTISAVILIIMASLIIVAALWL